MNQSTGVNLMSKEKCPNCNGVGKVKCPKCKGIGQLSDNGSYKTCSMCSVTANATCTTCIGSGWIGRFDSLPYLELTFNYYSV